MKCEICGNAIKIMIYRGTGVCSSPCYLERQRRAG